VILGRDLDFVRESVMGIPEFFWCSALHLRSSSSEKVRAVYQIGRPTWFERSLVGKRPIRLLSPCHESHTVARHTRGIESSAPVVGESGAASSNCVGSCKNGRMQTAPNLPPIDQNFEQVKLLFDYTKFHIGLYSTLAGAFVTLLASRRAEKWRIVRWLVGVALLAVVVAGGAGGVIASTLPSLTATKSFWAYETAPAWWPFGGFKIAQWASIEHGAFWIAILATIASVLPAAFQKPGGTAAEGDPLKVTVSGEITVVGHDGRAMIDGSAAP
jgi:hypothetical protein